MAVAVPPGSGVGDGAGPRAAPGVMVPRGEGAPSMVGQCIPCGTHSKVMGTPKESLPGHSHSIQSPKDEPQTPQVPPHPHRDHPVGQSPPRTPGAPCSLEIPKRSQQVNDLKDLCKARPPHCGQRDHPLLSPGFPPPRSGYPQKPPSWVKVNPNIPQDLPLPHTHQLCHCRPRGGGGNCPQDH